MPGREHLSLGEIEIDPVSGLVHEGPARDCGQNCVALVTGSRNAETAGIGCNRLLGSGRAKVLQRETSRSGVPR